MARIRLDTMRERMMGVGCTSGGSAKRHDDDILRRDARKARKSGKGRKIRNIRAFLNRFVRTRYPFLVIAHKEEMAQEIEIVVLMASRNSIKDTAKLEVLANTHFRQFAKDNGWYRDQTKGADTWVNPEQEWVKAAVEKYKQMARSNPIDKGD